MSKRDELRAAIAEASAETPNAPRMPDQSDRELFTRAVGEAAMATQAAGAATQHAGAAMAALTALLERADVSRPRTATSPPASATEERSAESYAFRGNA